MASKSKANNSAQDPPSDTAMEGVDSNQAQVEDEPTEDAEQQEVQDDEVEDEEEEEEQRVRMLPGSTEWAASFEFLDEGHTLGNALRYVIMKNPDVEFCAYAVPHPSEAKMNVRIQTPIDGPTTAIAALQKGLKDLQELCDVVADKFWDARQEFNGQKMDAMEA